MPTYSSSGYGAAVTMRSNRTLLVEGPTDKATIARLFLELKDRGQTKSTTLLVDTAADIPDASGGNRQRVEDMHARVGGSTKFAALVDREFRDFELAMVSDLNPTHREVPQNLFWTRGHSIENYLSDVDLLASSLTERFPEYLFADQRNFIDTAFPSILRSCASVSLAAVYIARLDRIKTISSLDIWRINLDGSMEFDLPKLQAELTVRHISVEERKLFASELKRTFARLVASDIRLSKWICHGHLAQGHIWCAIASLLRHHGLDNSIATQIGWGEREVLVRISRGAWSKQCAEGVGDYPAAFVNWLCA